LTLGGGLVRGTLLGDEVSLFTEEAIEKRPSSVATLVHVIAVHEERAGEWWHFFAIFHLKSVLHDLDNRHGVARTTGTLIDVITHEVDTFDLSQVERVGKFLVRNLT
jgi:hypothetical protein